MSSKKTIAIIGAGFAGTALAKALEKQLPDDYKIALLSKDNFITYNPLLAEVVGASIPPAHAVAPVRQIVKKSYFYMVDVTDIDYENRIIYYLGEGSGEIHYEHLVFACGTRAATSLVPGMQNHALPLKTLGDALFLRNRIMVRLEQAELQPDPELRKWLTSFIVIGGGFSGVEVAGEMQDLLRSSLRYYHNLNPEDCKVTLLHSRDCLLQELPESLGKLAQLRMSGDGIDVRTNTRVKRITDRGVILAPGANNEDDTEQTISAGTVINTIGTQPNPLITATPFDKEKGRLCTNPDMSVKSAVNVWALGDCAAILNTNSNRTCDPTAQFADRQGKALAKNIAARVTGQPTKPFGFTPLGALSTIGHNKAVAEVLHMKFSGLIGFLMWRAVYLIKIPTMARKARLFLEWNWDLFFSQDIVYLRFARSSREKPIRKAETSN